MEACCPGTFSGRRRKLLKGVAGGMLLGGSGLPSCATLQGGGAGVGSEFVIRNAYIVTLERAIGDIPRGDVYVRDGAIVGVGPGLGTPNAEIIDGAGMV